MVIAHIIVGVSKREKTELNATRNVHFKLLLLVKGDIHLARVNMNVS